MRHNMNVTKMCAQLTTKKLLSNYNLIFNNLIVVRHKSKIKFCGYLEPAEFKKRDIRYKANTAHRPKLMSWEDYQFRKWKADHWNKPFPTWQAKMDYAENLCRLGMSTWAIEKITDLHPHCIQYIQRKLTGNIELLRPAEYSAYVNHRSGDR